MLNVHTRTHLSGEVLEALVRLVFWIAAVKLYEILGWVISSRIGEI